MATRMKGAASHTCTMERSSNEPSSQNTISVTAKGLGDRLMASDVPAPARLPMARPASTSTTMVALRPATATTSAMETSAPAIAATGSSPREGADEAEIQHDDGSESRRLRRAENRRIGERIAQQSLQRRARKAENPADHEGQQGAGETDLAHHDGGAAEIDEQCFERARERDRRGTDDERGDGEDRDENHQAGNQKTAGHGARFSLPLAGRGRGGGRKVLARDDAREERAIYRLAITQSLPPTLGPSPQGGGKKTRHCGSPPRSRSPATNRATDRQPACASLRMNPLFANIPTTVFEVMSGLARDTGAINLGQGFPDDPGPEDVRRKAADAVLNGYNQYPSMMGLPELRSAIAAHYGHWQGLDLDPDHRGHGDVGSHGSAGGRDPGVVEPGDEVVLFEPMYDAYLPLVRLAGGIPRFVTLQPPHFRLTEEALAKAFSPKTKAVVFNNPLNPDRDDLLGRGSRAAGGFLPSLRRHRDLGRGLGARGVRRPPPSAGAGARGHARAQRQDRLRRQDLQPHGLEGRVRVRGTRTS